MKHLIQLGPVDWVKQIVNMNEVVGMKNHLTMDGGKKRLFCPFRRQDFWKCIGCIISAVTYRNKRHTIRIEIPKTLVRSHHLNYKDMFMGAYI